MPRKQNGMETVTAVCEKAALDMGYELCDALMEKEPAGQYLRIYIDKEGGVSLDDCERFHRVVQPKLDDVDYDFMEVCSPGIDRPIKTRRDVEKSIGLTVDVKLYRAQDGAKVFQGALQAMDEKQVVILISGQEKQFARRDVAQVRLVPDLSGLDENSDVQVQDIIDDE